MSIEPIGTTATSTPAQANPATPGLQGTKDEFLRLFMAQLQHQDPFAPTSGADMVAQLAQLSSVEQAKQTNDQLSALAATQASSASASLSSLVGRTCDAAADGFELVRGGQPPPLAVTSDSPMKGASIIAVELPGSTVTW